MAEPMAAGRRVPVVRDLCLVRAENTMNPRGQTGGAKSALNWRVAVG